MDGRAYGGAWRVAYFSRLWLSGRSFVVESCNFIILKDWEVLYKQKSHLSFELSYRTALTSDPAHQA